MSEKSNGSDENYYTVNEVVKISRLGRSTIYAMCKRGYLPNSKVGSRVLIPKKKFHTRLAELERKPDRK